jgi:transposase
MAVLLEQVQAVRPHLAVLEATSGYERGIVVALATAGLPVVVVNPRQVRNFAKAAEGLAKTAVRDAQVLAHFAEAVQLAPRPLSDETTQRLAALLERRRQLVAMLTAEKNRRQQPLATVRPLIDAHIAWLELVLSPCWSSLALLLARSSVHGLHVAAPPRSLTTSVSHHVRSIAQETVGDT